MKNIFYIIFTLLIFSSCRNDDSFLNFRNNSKLEFSQNNDAISIKITSDTDSLIAQLNPIRLEVFDGKLSQTLYFNYNSINEIDNKIIANAEFQIAKSTIKIVDNWSIINNSPHLNRKVKVIGNSDVAFLSAIEFKFVGNTREETEYFASGLIYGNTSNLSPNAIGGESLYKKGEGKLWIREDRMPAPILAFRFDPNNAFSILNAKPDGRTTIEDAHDIEAKTIIDENLRFGSFFAEHKLDTLKTGFAFPGTEGEYTYQGNTYPGGQMHKWRKRYHPLKDGLTQEYTLSFNSDNYSDFQKFYSSEYELAFKKLKPEVNHQDIELARKTMLEILPKLMIRKSNKVGLSNWYDATDSTDKLIDNKSVFGFTGKNIEIAYYLLYNLKLDTEYKDLAYEIINSFLDLKVSPPEGEGYYFENGEPALAIPHHQHIYLRSYGDGMKVLAKAYQLEKKGGKDQKEWLQWMTSFGNWILTQQYESGGFPRAWKPNTGKISAKSPASSYNIIPFLCEMYKITDEQKWLNSAIKTGEFSWNSGHNRGRFVGGTIDNPDVLDKEAGTLSIEAYLDLYEITKAKKWLDRAEVAAQYSETWMYIWNVPMVKDDSEKEWTNGVSTVGIQLISTGHSLADNYMAFDVDEYAKLYKYTGKQHYFDVAKILLHNTKGMLALPNRKYQYRAAGWIQEHWTMSIPRGKALHPGWLPWVTTSNLNGICETEIFDNELFIKLKN